MYECICSTEHTKKDIEDNKVHGKNRLLWGPSTVWLSKLFKISSFVFSRNSYRCETTWGWVNDRVE